MLYEHNFSYEICQSVMDTFINPAGDKTPTEAQTIIDPPIVVELIEAQTIVVHVVLWSPLWILGLGTSTQGLKLIGRLETDAV